MEQATNLLEKEVCTRIKALKGIDLSTDVGQNKLADVTDLYNLLIEGEKQNSHVIIEEMKLNNAKEIEILKSENELKAALAKSDNESMKLDLEMEKAETEKSKFEHQIELDNQKHDEDIALQKAQLKNDSTDRKLKFGLGIVEVVLPIMFYTYWTIKGLKYEETGTLSSPVFRNLWSKFRPTK